MTESCSSSTSAVLKTVTDLGFTFEVIEVDPALADTAVFCEKYGFPMEQSGNTIIVASKKEPKIFVACVVLATTKLDVNKCLRKLMGGLKASFASAEEMKLLTGMELGGVTPFSLPNEIKLYVDSRIMDLNWLILGGGGREKKIKISPEVFYKLGAEIINNLALPQTPLGLPK